MGRRIKNVSNKLNKFISALPPTTTTAAADKEHNMCNFAIPLHLVQFSLADELMSEWG